MNNTNPMFAKFDAVLGKTTPTKPTGAISSRADEIRNLAEQNTPEPSLLKKAADTGVNYLSGIGEGEVNAGKGLVQRFSDTKNTVLNNFKNAQNIATNGGTTQPTFGTSIGPAILAAGKSTTDILGQAATGAFDTAIKMALPFIPKTVRNAYGEATDQLIQDAKDSIDPSKATNPDDAEARQKVSDIVHGLMKVANDNPDVTGTIGNAIAMLLAPSGIEGSIKGVTGLKGLAEKGVNLAQKGVETATPVVKDLGESAVGGIKRTASDIKGKVLGVADTEDQKIADLISPKMTAKETKLAESQGRLVKGKEPTLLKSGTPDQVLTSDKVYNATQTIKREIPNASTMKEPELYSAIESKTSEMAKGLKPEMQKVPIKPETVSKITKDWETLKKTQIAEADASEEANVAKQQTKFESFLQKSKSGNMNDLWETRISYDDSIPANVKNANSMSPESLQNKKANWLQNRAILNNAINDVQNGMGETSRKAFSDMSNMYDAKQNLLSKAKLEVEGKPSKVKQFIEKHPTATKVIKYTAGGELIKKGLGF